MSDVRFQRLAEVVASAPPEPDWIVRGALAPGSITAIASPPKTGKSTLAFALLHGIEGGRRVLGLSTRPASAVLLSEERRDTLVAKFCTWPTGSTDLLLRGDARGTRWPQVIAAAIGHAKAQGHGIIVVDTFAAWAELHGDSENYAGAVQHAIQPLEQAAEAGLAVLFLTHTRKSGGDNGAGVRGSSALPAAVDILFELRRVQDQAGNARELLGVSRFDSTPERIRYRLVGQEIQVTDDDSELRRKIEEHRAANPKATANATAGAVGGNRQRALRLIRESGETQFPEGRNQPEPVLLEDPLRVVPTHPPMGGEEPPEPRGTASVPDDPEPTLDGDEP